MNGWLVSVLVCSPRRCQISKLYRVVRKERRIETGEERRGEEREVVSPAATALNSLMPGNSRGGRRGCNEHFFQREMDV